MNKTVDYLATREGFARAVRRAASQEKRVVLLGADVTGSLGLNPFIQDFPEQYLSFGIAEQNIASVAAGLALCGLRPIFSTYATFATTRALDQIRVSICYNNAPVLIGGAHAGVSVGPDGATHQALEDVATMRVLPRMRVFSPCDANETEAIVYHLLTTELTGPVYVRFGRAAVPNFTTREADFNPMKSTLLRKGHHLSLIATGHMVWQALEAANILSEQHGIECNVLNARCLKPLDTDSLHHCVNSSTSRLLFTLEEHQIVGGLGSAVCEYFSARKDEVQVIRVGLDDGFGESGAPQEVMKHFHLDAEGITHRVLSEYRQ